MNYWKPLFMMYDYLRNRFNPYLFYINAIRKQNNKTCKTRINVLITIIGGAYGHLFEGLFARKAALNGYSPYILRCNSFLDYCDVNPEVLSHRILRCLLCQARQDDFMKAFHGVDCKYEDYIDRLDIEALEQCVDDYFTKGLREYENVNIKKILYSALQRFYLIAEPKVVDDKVTRGFLFTIFATLTVMDKICNQIHPQYVLSSHGTYSTWGSVVEYCKSHGIYVITHGQNYNHGGIEFTYDDSYLTGDLNDTENKWNELILSEAVRKRVRHFLDERLGRVSDDKVAFDYNKGNKKHYTRKQICEILHIDSDKKIVGMFPNIPWDGAVTGGGAVVFPNYKDWFEFTIKFFAKRDDSVLVIRSHPAEVNIGTDAGRESTATLINEIFGKTPSNIRILGPKHEINSYTLGENCDFGITFSSTVSLELTYLGIPIILCGCPPFKGKDVAFDVTSKEQYIELIEKGINGELSVTQERIDRLFRYLHYFFFMRTMPQTLVEVKDTVPQRFLFTSEEELDKDPVFDYMFRKISAKEELDFSGFWDAYLEG